MDFAGKTAFVTGAAQGIGLGICRALAGAGAHVVMADIEAAPLARARDEIAALGVRATAKPLDVSDHAAYARVAAEIEAECGTLHILCNNAGVSTPPGPISALPVSQWDWLLGVNLYGVIHGVSLLLPLIRRHGGEGHVVNTASIAGFQVRPGRGTGAYAASKFAVVAYSEALEQELAATPVGVSVLCPAAVDTSIYQSLPRRPARFGGPGERVDAEVARGLLADGLHPDVVGRRVLQAIRQREFMIFTHPETKAWLQDRHDRVMAAFT